MASSELRKSAPPKTPGIKARKVERSSVGEDVAKQIMSLISKGELKPGQRLPSERELCLSFDVGRSSLREALRSLSMVGILDARVGEGTSVAQDSRRFIEKSFEWSLMTEHRDVEALVQVRVALEGAAAAQAALHADTLHLATLRKLLDEMGEVLDDQRRFAELDLQFHVTLSEACQNSLLFGLVTMIRSQLVRAMERVLTLPNARLLSHEEHLAIFRSVEARDAASARQKMQDHLEASLSRYSVLA